MVNNIIQKRRQCNKRSNGITPTERRSNGNIPLSYAPEGRKTMTTRIKESEAVAEMEKEGEKGRPAPKKRTVPKYLPEQKQRRGPPPK